VLAILLQHDVSGRDYVIAYSSKKLTEAQQKWDACTLEAFAALWGCEYYRHYLLGSPFELLTDHESLKWMMSPTSTGKMARWAICLSEFVFVPKYRPGKRNANADALSHIEIPGDQMEVDFEIPTFGDEHRKADSKPKLHVQLIALTAVAWDTDAFRLDFAAAQ